MSVHHRVAEDHEILNAVVVTNDDEVFDLVLAGAWRGGGSEDLIVVPLDDEVLDSRGRPDFDLVVVAINAQVVYGRLEHALVHIVVVHSD